MREASVLPDDDDRYDIDDPEWESLREQLRDADSMSRSTYPHCGAPPREHPMTGQLPPKISAKESDTGQIRRGYG